MSHETLSHQTLSLQSYALDYDSCQREIHDVANPIRGEIPEKAYLPQLPENATAAAALRHKKAQQELNNRHTANVAIVRNVTVRP